MAFNLGAMTQFSDTNSIADPMVMVAAKAISLAPGKGAFYQAMMDPLAALPLNTESFEIYNRTKTSSAFSHPRFVSDLEIRKNLFPRESSRWTDVASTVQGCRQTVTHYTSRRLRFQPLEIVKRYPGREVTGVHCLLVQRPVLLAESVVDIADHRSHISQKVAEIKKNVADHGHSSFPPFR